MKTVKELKDLIGGWLISLGYKTKDFKQFTKEQNKDTANIKFYYREKRLIFSIRYINEFSSFNDWVEFDFVRDFKFIKDIISNLDKTMNLTLGE